LNEEQPKLNSAISEEQPSTNFAVSKITSRLLELFRQEMQRRTGLPVSTGEAMAFIVEDYTKTYYSNLSGNYPLNS
jgi:hypothetical protein